jgi:hypothetical protein
MITKSKIFSAAWAVAKQGAAKFGGSARQYFAEALRMAYAAVAARAAKAAAPVMTTAAKINALANILMSWSRPARKSFAWTFVMDNAERVARFGEKTTFSAKQIEIINDLYAKYA